MVLLCVAPPSIEYIKSSHTPAADVIEWQWLVIFYLMDVFNVVYKAICAPPPVLHLNL